MAGGSETPRQKMIGMMYLVLTALLALQVSSAVLEKFAIINVTLEELKAETNAKNAALATQIKAGGEKKTSPKVKNAVANSQQVRDLTTKTLATLDLLKENMIKKTGSFKVDEALIHNHGSDIATMMIDPRVKTGKDFEKTLNDYVTKVSELSGEKYEKIAKAPSEIEFFAENPDNKSKDFLTFTFENTPPIAALASVTEFQTQILDMESRALDKLSKDAEAGTVKFETIVPMVRPRASIVAAGDKYQADLFIAAAADGITPTMFRDGQSVAVSADVETGIQMGKIEFLASAGAYDAKTGLAKKTFMAEIRGVGDSTYKRTIEYFVAKPVIRVTTGNAPTLYMNCGNNVNIEVPALGTNYNPTFQAKGADIVKGGDIGKVTIIPKERKVSVTVINGGATLGIENFDVKPIPAPKYVAKDNGGKDIDLKNGVTGSALTGLRVIAEADENFKTEVPKDAVYRIRSMEVILARGTAQVQRLNPTSELIELGAWRSQFRPGDRIVIDIKTVTRRTFQGQDEPVAVTSSIINIPIK